MGHYSRQLITEIEKHIDEKLIQFFKTNYDIKHFPYDNIRDVIDDTLMTHFGGRHTRDDLVGSVYKNKRTRIQKRSRWYKSYFNDLTLLDHNDPAYPLDLSKYDECERDELVKREIEKLEKWKSDRSIYLVEFPWISQFTDASIYNTFKSDLLVSMWGYIVQELNGNIGSFYRSFPISLIENPLFSPSSFNLNVKETENSFLEEIVYDDELNDLLKIVIPNNVFNPPKVMDATDLKILNAFISNVNNDFYQDKTVIIDLNTLAKSVVDYKPGANVLKSISERCTKLVEYSYSVRTDKERLAFNLFDNIVIEEAERPYVRAQFGEVLANAIIQKKLINVTSDSYSNLSRPLSQIIYYALQQERVSLQTDGRNRKSYTYTYFQKIARFGTLNKLKNIKLIKDSLQDFVDHGICVKSYKYLNYNFYIEYLELTEEEWEDMNFEEKRIDAQ